jgi:hypothetical protein
MTLTTGLIVAGSLLALLGLAMLGWCIWRALAIRRAGETEDTTAQMQTLVAVNMAAVGIASIGLGCVVVGFIL